MFGDSGAAITSSTDADVVYETKNMQVIRGTEKLNISKWEKDGWELVAQTPGKLRTELILRRPKPKLQWKLFAIIGGVLVVLFTFIGIMAALTGESSDTAEPASSPTTQPADTTKGESSPREEPSTDPDQPVAAVPAEETPLTIETSADLAALLTGPSEGPSVEAFAQQYAGRLIEFDGSIGAMNNHDGYSTRYDILIVNGDYSETHSNGGPNFQFRDVNITNDLHLTGDVPDTIGVGTNVHVIARVGSFKDQLFQVEPVSTEVR